MLHVLLLLFLLQNLLECISNLKDCVEYLLVSSLSIKITYTCTCTSLSLSLSLFRKRTKPKAKKWPSKFLSLLIINSLLTWFRLRNELEEAKSSNRSSPVSLFRSHSAQRPRSGRPHSIHSDLLKMEDLKKEGEKIVKFREGSPSFRLRNQ